MIPQAPAISEVEGKSFGELSDPEYEALPQYVKDIDTVATMLWMVGIHGDTSTQREAALFAVNSAMERLAEIKIDIVTGVV